MKKKIFIFCVFFCLSFSLSLSLSLSFFFVELSNVTCAIVLTRSINQSINQSFIHCAQAE